MAHNERQANEDIARQYVELAAKRMAYENERERFARILSTPAPKRARRRGWIRSLLSF